MTRNGDVADLAAEQARLVLLRQHLGAHLAASRRAAAVTQPDLAHALERTRSTVSKVEHGTRAMPEQLWKIADDVCRADGALIAAHTKLVQAERDYRERCRTQRRQARLAAAQAELKALQACPVPEADASPPVPGAVAWTAGLQPWPDAVPVGGPLAGELIQVVARLVRSLGRREAMRVTGQVFAALSLSGTVPGLDSLGLLNSDDYARVAHAVHSPHRVDAHVIENLAAVLARCKRLEDTLGPLAVLDTVIAQHHLVHHLLNGGCPDQFSKPLHLVDSTMAAAIGDYFIDMGDPHTARGYFHHARQAAHHAGNPACAAYAAQAASFAARLCGDTPATLDTAAAARSLAARTSDNRLKALTEQMAAGAFAIDSQYDACMAAFARAHQFLTNTTTPAPESPAYWVHHATIDSHYTKALLLLDKPNQAIEAASAARAHYDQTYIGGYAMCEIRLAHALVLAREITEATRILINTAHHAHLYPRLAQELHTARKLLQPWQHTAAVKTLDDQLKACKLFPARQPN
jgi:DNA-binding XRE family transcriptional regulator